MYKREIPMMTLALDKNSFWIMCLLIIKRVSAKYEIFGRTIMILGLGSYRYHDVNRTSKQLLFYYRKFFHNNKQLELVEQLVE